MRRVISWMISIVMTVSVILSDTPSGVVKVKAGTAPEGYQVSSPVTDEDGVTTWDCVYFGNYYQTGNDNPVKEPIRWRVLSVEGDDAFLLAEKSLESMPYNETHDSVTWETCTLRKWLNDDFYNDAFTDDEKKAIMTTTVVNTSESPEDAEQGNNTRDKLYLLSQEEVTDAKYGFWTDASAFSDSRKTEHTEYARRSGTSSRCWWLRTLGPVWGLWAKLVLGSGYCYQKGYSVADAYPGVRPVLHLDLSSAEWKKAGTVSYQTRPEPVCHTVTYMDGDKKADLLSDEGLVFQEGEGLKELPIPRTRDSYEFKGWYEDEEFTIPVVRIEKDMNEDITLYARWEPVDYSITYENWKGGKNPNPLCYTIENKDIVLRNPSETGYEFVGWTCEGQTEPVKEMILKKGSAGDRHFVANWKDSVCSPVVDEDGMTTWDCVYFGSYYQSNDQTKEPIKWRVLSVEEDDVYLLADTVLDCQPYSITDERATWENSTVREWLNRDFYNTAFTDEEKRGIRSVTVINRDDYMNNGSNTRDRIYLLSEVDVTNPDYGFPLNFEKSDTRKAENTEYVLQKGSYPPDGITGTWWLRPKNNWVSAAVDSNGGQCTYLSYGGTDIAVRPVLHMYLSSASWKKAGTVSSSGGPRLTYHSITYMDGDEEAEMPAGVKRNFKEGEGLAVIPEPEEKAGYMFGGWYEDEDFTSQVKTIEDRETKDIVLYGKWMKIEYPITYKDWRGGKNPNPAGYTVSDSDIILQNPSSGEDIFIGWTYEGQEKPVKTVRISQGSTGDICFTANWKEDTVHNPIVYKDGPSVWDCVYFGNYYQKDDETMEPIKWRVLSVDGGDAFLMADKILDMQAYNAEDMPITWAGCSLRKWLNGEFYEKAFSEEERKAVLTTHVINENSPFYGTPGGNNTYDKVYLLSTTETLQKKYGFSTDEGEWSDTRKAEITERIVVPWIASGGNRYFDWWLRTPGYYTTDVVCMTETGVGYNSGCSAAGGALGVRPVLHLDLSSDTWQKAGTVRSDGKGEDPVDSPDALFYDLKLTDNNNFYTVDWKKVNGADYFGTIVVNGTVIKRFYDYTNIDKDSLGPRVKYIITLSAMKDGKIREESIDLIHNEPGGYAVGNADKSSSFYSAFSPSYQIKDGDTLTVNFDCYGNAEENWKNFAMIFSKDSDPSGAGTADEKTVYAVIRADKYGWSNRENSWAEPNVSLSGDAIVYDTEETDWEVFRSIMEAAAVTLEVKRQGNTVTIVVKAVSKGNPSWVFTSSTLFKMGVRDSEGRVTDDGMGDLYMTLTVDHAYLIIRNTSKDTAPGSSAGTGNNALSVPQNPGTATKVKKPGRVKKITVKENKKKSVRISWKKVSGAAGYQVQYATNKKFKKGKKTLCKKNKIRIKKLKKNKVHFVRIRAYKKKGRKKIYGKWSAIKKVKA